MEISKTIVNIGLFVKKIKPYKLTIILLSIVFILIFSLYFREKKKVSNITNIDNSEIEEIVEMVGELIILPKDSKPDIATIANVDKLKEKDSNFYKNASNGDMLLIYPDQVILYSPKENIIINVAPIIPDSVIEKVGKDK